MDQSDIQAILQDAIMLVQSGQRTEARRLLKQVIEADPDQELAWMWLATVSIDQQERVTCLKRVLALNPNNTTAREAYAKISGQPFTPPVSDETAPLSPPDSQDHRVRLARAGLIIITMLGLLAVAVFVLAGQLDDDDDQPGSRPVPTRRPAQDQTTTPPDVSPTRTVTPRPTRTPGPSPTSIWDSPPPTWTEAATYTPAPSPTRAPSFTPYPTAAMFIGPYAKSATAEFVLTSDAGPATVAAVRTQAAITPTRTLAAGND